MENMLVDSIEGSLVKLLYSENEEIEEVISIDLFSHKIKQGDIVSRFNLLIIK